MVCPLIFCCYFKVCPFYDKINFMCTYKGCSFMKKETGDYYGRKESSH